MFLKEFFEKVSFEGKKTADHNVSMKDYPTCRVNDGTIIIQTQMRCYGWLQLIRVLQGLHRVEKYLNIQDCLEKSLKIKFALKST